MDLLKLRHGVLRVTTSVGTRYVGLSAWQRLRLMWVFRNFTELPETVMNPGQQHLIATLCTGSRYLDPTEVDVHTIIGTVERKPAQPLPPRKTPVREMAPLLPARRHG